MADYSIQIENLFDPITGRCLDDRLRVNVSAPLIVDPLVTRNYVFTITITPNTGGASFPYTYIDSANAAASTYQATIIFPEYSGISLEGSLAVARAKAEVTDRRTGITEEVADFGNSNFIHGRLSPPVFVEDTTFVNPSYEIIGDDIYINSAVEANSNDKTGVLIGEFGRNGMDVGVDSELMPYPPPQSAEAGYTSIWGVAIRRPSGEYMVDYETLEMISNQPYDGPSKWGWVSDYRLSGYGSSDIAQVLSLYRAYWWGDIESVVLGYSSGSTLPTYGIEYTDMQDQWTSDVTRKIIYGPTITTNDDDLEIAGVRDDITKASSGVSIITLTCPNIITANTSYIEFYYVDGNGKDKMVTAASSLSYEIPIDMPTRAWATARGNNNVFRETKTSRLWRSYAQGGGVPYIRSAVFTSGGLRLEIIPPSTSALYYILLIDGEYCETTLSSLKVEDAEYITHTFSSDTTINKAFDLTSHSVSVYAYNSVANVTSRTSNLVEIMGYSSGHLIDLISSDAQLKSLFLDGGYGIGMQSSNVIIENTKIESRSTFISKDSASVCRELFNDYVAISSSTSLNRVSRMVRG